MPISELPDTVWREIPVKGRPADLELLDHVADEGVVFRILEQGLCLPELLITMEKLPGIRGNQH